MVYQELTQGTVWEWILSTSGWFTSRELDNELEIVTSKGKASRRTILARLVQSEQLERHPYKNGVFRRLEKELIEIDWQGADPKNIMKLRFPFGLEKYVKIFPKSVVVVAGTKNAGKTLLLYLTILLNMARFCIDLYNTETGKEQMKERLDSIDPNIPNPPPFKAFERYDNFADVIHPDHISIIDYLDVGSEAYQVGDEIDKIFRKLNKGVVIIGLQKPPGRDLGYGKGATEKRAVLYLVLDRAQTEERFGKEIRIPPTLKILHAKNPADPKINPNGMQWNFHIDKGAKFIITKYPLEEENE